MAWTLGQLAQRVGGRVVGDEQTPIRSVAAIETAGPGDITFLSNPKYEKLLAGTRASAIIVSPKVTKGPTSLLQADDPYFAFRQVMVDVYGWRPRPAAGVSPLAVVDPTAELGETVSVGPFVTVEAGARIGARTALYPGCYVGAGAAVGADCLLFPNVVIYDGCILGDRVTLHANTVIGQDGFGYSTHDGAHHKIPQAGIARVGDDVEMGAGCAVDRATLGETVIGSGTKFSDLVAIGHGARIGSNCLFVAQVGIAGSVEVGDYGVFAGQVGVAGHLKIGQGVTIAAKAGVINDIPAGQTVLGQPAMEISRAKRNYAAFVGLADLRERVRQLEARIRELEKAEPGPTPGR